MKLLMCIYIAAMLCRIANADIVMVCDDNGQNCKKRMIQTMQERALKADELTPGMCVTGGAHSMMRFFGKDKLNNYVFIYEVSGVTSRLFREKYTFTSFPRALRATTCENSELLKDEAFVGSCFKDYLPVSYCKQRAVDREYNFPKRSR